MGEFLTTLEVELLTTPEGRDLRTHGGKQLWRVIDCVFIYASDVVDCTIDVPVGFVTDFASIPQALSNIFGDIGHRASLPHDFEYSNKGTLTRGEADSVLREACIDSGVAAWKANMIYAGVRAFGWMFFRKEDQNG